MMKNPPPPPPPRLQQLFRESFGSNYLKNLKKVEAETQYLAALNVNRGEPILKPDVRTQVHEQLKAQAGLPETPLIRALKLWKTHKQSQASANSLVLDICLRTH